jgi:hypothetical protein
MKIKIGLGVIAISAFGASLAFGASIVGSKHDMTELTGAEGEGGRVCAYCHTPHHALDTGEDYAPLWSHTVTSKTYTAYTSDTLDAGVIADPLAGVSKLCFSCHDGAIAVDQHYQFDGAVMSTAVPKVGGGFRGGDGWGGIDVGVTNGLSNDHPVGFNYDDVATADLEIRPSTTAVVTGGTIADLMVDGLMTCGSCHDVHGTRGAVGDRYFLVAPTAASEICLVCHIK